MHFDLQHTVTGAGLAASAPGVERKPARPVAPCLGLLGGGKQIADVVEEIRIGGRIGARCASDGTLVNGDDLVQIFHAVDPVMLAGMRLHAVELHAQLFIENLVDQTGFAAAGHAGDAGKGAQRNGHIDVFQVILPGAADGQPFAAALTAAGRYFDLLFAAEILARQRIGMGHDLLGRTGRHHMTAVTAGARPDVNQVIGGAHGVLVMLHHDQGIAQIAQAAQRGKQLVVIALVQADRRLVQNIQHAHQAGADLRGQADTLAFTAGERSGGTGQRQIRQAHALQKAQPGANLLQDLRGDQLLRFRQRQPFKKRQRLVHRQLRCLIDGLTPYGHRQRFAAQSLTVADGTGTFAHIFFDFLFRRLALGFCKAALQIVHNALKRLVQNALAPGLIVCQLQRFPVCTVEDRVLDLIGQLPVRCAQGKLVFLAEGLKIHPRNAVRADRLPAGRRDGAVQNGQAFIGDDQRGVRL